MSKLTSKTRRAANKNLGKVPTYHKSVGLALAAILDALEPFGLAFGLLQHPKTATARVLLSWEGQEVSNSILLVQTHHMEQSGNIELTCYVS